MIITLKNLYKIIGGEVLFESLDMAVKSGQRVGLVGRNGSGKSTLFRIITKEEGIDGGNLFIQKGMTIGYLKQTPYDWDNTGRSYLQLAFDKLMAMDEQMKKLEKDMLDPEKMDKAIAAYGEIQERFTQEGGYEMDASIRQVANGLNVETLLDQPFSTLSGGEKTKLGLAKLLLEKPDVLLLDEPTNHLDLQAIEWLEGYLQQYAGTICVISHDRSFLDHIVTDIMDLESGEIHMYRGNYSAFEKQKEEKLLEEFHQYEEQQKRIKKMKEAIRRLRQWANEANPPNPKLFKKAKSMEKALERMEKVEKPFIDPKKMNLSLEVNGRTGKDVFLMDSLEKKYGSKTVLKNLDLHIRYQDRLAIVGTNGSGKSTLLKILLGKEAPTSGSVRCAPSMKIGYLPQNPLQGADRDQRMIDHFREYIRVTEGEARHRLAGFMFYGYDVFRKIRHLSGGEQMRLKLAIFMYQDIQLLILDEPTNHLDVDSQEVLEEALNKFKGTVIGVSHDRHFLDRCFTQTAYLVEGKIYSYLGTYEETKKHWYTLLETKGKEKGGQPGKPPEPITEETAPPEDWEREIEHLEQQVSAIEKQMEECEDVETFIQLEAQKGQREEILETLYKNWLERQ
ncbi:ATPase components of ABC transporters with duplicated ATPase domains [Halobacillus karajensis]|uniref:ABC transporter ATP-binding protein YheS n=1 Tax=Halobacillus karajensis TaxID=195088 RepID=A0A024P931_9BACI|nr:ABC-F type ribosomal protection protein [Halobacillus karajensis]CDQ21515.1 putative ABC transporter ATP-binding protein YheS [Halobacillus karajensis]CDQ25450.1 putative ABC transporter ATP-binding protein YheS [Halobacillus karajensis]CDQ29019.1 putative ABC transporter ATP-binding protein YheS [Halobacillus karajensis]SEI09344.1 ATPase components of ABC transporters with duplicated ATPase domains [Halobacillus karajensis]